MKCLLNDPWTTGNGKGFAPFNLLLILSSLGTDEEHTHWETHTGGKWGRPAAPLEHQGQRGIIFATERCLSKYRDTDTIATLPNVDIFTRLASGVRQVVFS